MKRLIILLTAFVLLVACNGKEVSKDQGVSEKEVVEETNAEANEETDSVVDVEPVDKLTAFTDYSKQIFLPLQSIFNDIQTIQMLCELGATDPTILLGSGYSDMVQATADDLHENIAKIRATEVDDPELQEIYNYLLQSVDELEFVANNFPIGVREMNADLIYQCRDALERSAGHLREANRLMEDYKNKYDL